MQHQLPVFAMDRDNMLRSDEFYQPFQIFPATMSADMDIEEIVVVQVCAQTIEVIKGAMNHLLVPRYRGSADDDGIALTDAQMPVLTAAHAHQSAGGFTLAACAYDHDLFRREVIHLIGGQQTIGWGLEITQF